MFLRHPIGDENVSGESCSQATTTLFSRFTALYFEGGYR